MFQQQITMYLEYCKSQKNLDSKTITAYQIDLKQFEKYLERTEFLSETLAIPRAVLMDYMAELHKLYKPRSVKRKLASLKAFFGYLEYEEFVEVNPFNKIKVRYFSIVL